MTKFKLVACEIYNRNFHGGTSEEDYMQGSYMVVFTESDICDEEDDEYTNEQNSDTEELTSIQHLQLMCTDYYYQFRINFIETQVQSHSFIRNYKMIISNKDYIKPEIALCLTLKGGEHVAILQTFWIKIIQRTWKKIFEQRKQYSSFRNIHKKLVRREIYGPPFTFPKLRGMLFSLMTSSTSSR